MRSPGLAALVDDAAFIAFEAQLQIADQVGEHSWGVDLEAGKFRFEGESPAEYGVQLLGSAAPGPRSWLWGWANPSGYSPQVLSAANATRALGEQYSITELTSAEVPFDAGDDPSGEAGYSLGYDLSLAARVATRSWFGYSGQVQGGTRVWMLLEGLQLNAPSFLRTSRVFSEALMATTISDHRRAVGSYAAFRGLAWDGTTLSLPDGNLAVEFDAQGRIANMSGTVGPA